MINLLRTNQNKEFLSDKVFFWLVITLSVIQQMPIIYEILYSEIRYLLYILFAVYGFFSILRSQDFIKITLFKLFIFTFIYTFFLSLLVNKAVFNDLIIPLGILIVSFNSRFDEKYIHTISKWFIFITTIMAVSSVYYYAGSFLITTSYGIPAKNQIGPMISIAILISFFNVLNKNKLKPSKVTIMYFFLSMVLLFACLLVIRNRSGIVSIVICSTLYYLLSLNTKLTLKKLLLLYIIICIFLILYLTGLFNPLFTFIWDSMTLNYDVTDIESLSAGRVETYFEAISFTINNPIFGAIMTKPTFIGTPHNYLINVFAQYGFIFGTPLALLYLYLWFFVFKNIFNKRNRDMGLVNEPLWILLFTLFVSMLEVTYPYGPGTSQLMMWFLVGHYLKNKRYIYLYQNKSKFINTI